MNSDVFLSLLALDSYNRGYGAGLNDLDFRANVTKIGNATIKTDSEIELGDDAEQAGFYAIAYEWRDPEDGELKTVISYRGTSFDDWPATNDITNGWTLDAGRWALGARRWLCSRRSGRARHRFRPGLDRWRDPARWRENSPNARPSDCPRSFATRRQDRTTGRPRLRTLDATRTRIAGHLARGAISNN